MICPYALNITEESDTAKYISLRTLWKNRNILAQNSLEGDIFKASTDQLSQIFKVNTEKQRIDSVHIKSNMWRLGRIGIFSESIHKFLKNLKRSQKEQFDTIDKKVSDKYLTKDALGCFSTVKLNADIYFGRLNRALRALNVLEMLSVQSVWIPTTKTNYF